MEQSPLLRSLLSAVRKALFKTLQFNKRLLDLGSKILQSPEPQYGAFIGVDLRGESDWPAGFGGVSDQMALYVEAIEQIQNTSTSGVKVGYVSCGDPAVIGLLRDMLSATLLHRSRQTNVASRPA